MGHSSMTTVITPFAGHVYVYVNSSARTAHMTEQAYKASRSRLATSQETAMPCHHSSQHASATQTALAADLPPTNPAHARPAACSCCPRCDGHLLPAPLERCATRVAALIPLPLAALEADGLVWLIAATAAIGNGPAMTLSATSALSHVPTLTIQSQNPHPVPFAATAATTWLA